MNPTLEPNATEPPPVKRKIIKRNRNDLSFSAMSEEDLISLTKKEVSELEVAKLKIFDSKKIDQLQKRLLQIRKEFIKRGLSNTSNIGSIYPEVDDPEFSSKLLTKKEFAGFKYKSTNASRSYEEQVQERCGINARFQLTKNQKFLKNFMSPATDYNSLLLFHSVGVGKTCSAISIAEQFTSVFPRKIVAIMPTALKDNFKKQLFDITKIDRKNMDAVNQCVASKYLEQIADRHIIDDDALEKRVNQIIKEKYQFFGFREFANIILNMKKGIELVDAREESVEAKLNAAIKEQFSNCVIIIDEAHNVRAEDEKTQKIVPPMLLKVLQAATNIKLIILTATPMFNEAKEIVWLLNLILANEKKPLIDEADVFDKDGQLKDAGRHIIASTAQGYVSYMRGQNPFSFPTRLDPTINHDKRVLSQSKLPKHDIYGRKLEDNELLKDLKLIGSEMSDYQSSIYKKVERVADITDTDDYSFDENTSGKEKHSSLARPLQISNIAYPVDTKKDYTINMTYGENGFWNCFDKIPGSKMLKVKYKPTVKSQFGEFLHPDKVHEYSAKLKQLIEYIKQSDGIVFIYSYYVWGGILPLAIALEHAGFSKSGGQGILSGATDIDKPFIVNNSRATYSILTRDTSLVTNISNEIEKIKSIANKNGENIKVILGTNVTSEGIDFKNIREVHLMEPWHHLNRIEQIVGRAIRTCSHVSLPPEKRNTTVYYHAGYPSYYLPKRIESIDLRMYRIAEIKQKNILEVEKLLKENAVDCYLNMDASYFDPSKLKMEIDLKTSQGKLIKKFKLGDNPAFSTFKPITCTAAIEQNTFGSNSSTFNNYFYEDEIDLYKDAIANTYSDYAQTFTFSELDEKLQTSLSSLFDRDVLKHVLDILITSKTHIKSSTGLYGQLIYHGKNYTLIPVDEPFSYTTTHRRRHYEVIQSHRIKLEQGMRTNDKKQDEQHAHTGHRVNKVYEASLNTLNNLFGDTNKSDPLFAAALDHTIDRLEEPELLLLAEDALNTSETCKDIIDSLQRAQLLRQLGKSDYFRTPFHKDTVYIHDHGKLRELSPLEVAKYNRYIDPLQEFEGKNIKAFKAYIDISPKGINFKRVGDKDHSDGYICSQTTTLKVDDFKHEISEIDSQTLARLNKATKPKLCEVYELILRKMLPTTFARPLVALMVRTKKKEVVIRSKASKKN